MRIVTEWHTTTISKNHWKIKVNGRWMVTEPGVKNRNDRKSMSRRDRKMVENGMSMIFPPPFGRIMAMQRWERHTGKIKIAFKWLILSCHCNQILIFHLFSAIIKRILIESEKYHFNLVKCRKLHFHFLGTLLCEFSCV